MSIFIDSPEERNKEYTGHHGRVLSVQTHVGTAVNRVGTGSDIYVSSSVVEVKKARVALDNGRIKEIDTYNIEMQEDDKVELITSDDGGLIYLKNSTTGSFYMDELCHEAPVGLCIFIAVSVVMAGFGLVSIFSSKSYFVGSICFAAGLIVLFKTSKAWGAWLQKIQGEFHKKIRATGIDVQNFKPVKQSSR